MEALLWLLRELRALFAKIFEGMRTQARCVLDLAVTLSIRHHTAGGKLPIKPCACHRLLVAPVPRCVLACSVLDAAFLNRLAIRRTQEASVLDLLLGLTTSV